MSLSFTGRCCACLTFLCFTAVGTAQPVEPAVAKAKNNHDSTLFTTVDPAGYLPDWLTKTVTTEAGEWSVEEFRDWLEQQCGVPVMIDYNRLDLDRKRLLKLRGNGKEEPLYATIQRAVQQIPGATFSFEDETLTILPHFSSTPLGIGSLRCFNISQLKTAGYDMAGIPVAFDRYFWQRPDAQRRPTIIGDTLVGRMDDWEASFTRAFLKTLESDSPATIVFLPEVDRKLLELLDRPINAEFIDTPLLDVLAAVSDQIGTPIAYNDSALSSTGVSVKASITTSFRDVKLTDLPQVIRNVSPQVVSYPHSSSGNRYYRLQIAPHGGQLLLTHQLDRNLWWCGIYNVRNGEASLSELKRLETLINQQIVAPHYPQASNSGQPASRVIPLGNGRLAVFDHWQVQQEIASFLQTYEEAVPVEKQPTTEPPKKQPVNTAETYEVRFYPMSEELANSLQHSLPKLVNGRWEEGFNAANGPHYGQAAAITDNGKTMLAIRQTKEVHEQVEEFLKNYAAAGKAAPEVEAGGETSQSEKTPTSPE